MRVFAGDYSGICLGVAGWHGVARNPAPPCHPLFYWCFGYPTGQGHPLRCVAAIPCSMAFGGIRLQTAANPRIYRGFACIRLQSGGGNRQKSVPPPVFIGNLQPDAPLQLRRWHRARSLQVDQPNLTCAKDVGKRQNPNKHRGWHAVRLRRATPCLPATLSAMLSLISGLNYAS